MVSLSFTTILSAVFLVTLLVYAIFSAVLFWHWKQFSTGTFTTVGTMVVYLGVSGFLFVLMASSLMWYSAL